MGDVVGDGPAHPYQGDGLRDPHGSYVDHDGMHYFSGGDEFQQFGGDGWQGDGQRPRLAMGAMASVGSLGPS